MTGLVQGLAAAGPEVGGLLAIVLLVLLLHRAGQAWDRAAARRRRLAIATARALESAPAWVTPEMVYVRDGRVIGLRWQGRLDDADGQVAALSSMMVRQRRAGAR